MILWLETSVVVALHFRSRNAREACSAVLAGGKQTVVSRYVLFELARGYLSRLRRFHDASMHCRQWFELRNLVKEGSNDYTYEGKAWRDVLDDIEQALELEASDSRRVSPWMERGHTLAFFRVRLRRVVQDGWEESHEAHQGANPAGCREDLPAPYLDEAGLLQHDLPTDQCGQPGNCGVLAFVRQNAAALEQVRASDGKSKAKAKKGERDRRMEGLEHLLKASESEAFAGERCHHCGDAMIAMEATAAGGCAVTKDKEFPRICKAMRGAAPVVVKHTP